MKKTELIFNSFSDGHY